MKTQSPKILVIGSTYPRHQEDHQVPWLRETVNRTAQSGHEIEVLASSFKGMKPHQIDGVKVHRFRYAPAAWETLTHDEGAPNKLKGVFGYLLSLSYLAMGTLQAAWLGMRNRYDIVHVHWPFPHGVMGLVAAFFSGAKVVSNCHGAELAMARNSGWVRQLLRFCLKKSDLILCNSSHTRQEIKRLCDCEATILPYGATATASLMSAPPRHQGPFRLLFCGRLIERKGVDYLLRALPLVQQQFEVTLDITGEGDCKRKWEELSSELGLEKVVNFRGFVSNEELARLYAECHLYVHPAIFDRRGDTEGLGVVLIEALVHEKPVVASAVGGIVDVIIDEQTGLLVPEKDPAALAAAICKVLADPQMASALGIAGKKHAASFFNWDRIISELSQIYQGLGAPQRVTAPHGTITHAA